MLLSAVFAARGEAEPRWRIDVDTQAEDFLLENSFGDLEYGFTDVVPPFGMFRQYSAIETPDGYMWEMHGTELSIWQTAEVPRSARYLLNWHFLYEGAVLGGRGRTGFIFGNPTRSNLMSIEITASGSLRAVMWGESELERHGRIIFSRRAAKNAAAVKIEAFYDIRNARMICRVNDGEEILIDFKKYIPSPPITIQGVGFFSAVPEAKRRMGVSSRRRTSALEIDLSPSWARTLHKKLITDAK